MHTCSRLFTWSIVMRLLALIFVFSGSLLHAGPEKWAEAVEKFVASDQVSPPAKGGVLFVGSSSISRWSGLKRAFPDFNVINRGLAGSTFPDTIHYLDRIALPYAPRAVVVYAGENDIKEGATPEKVTSDFATFCKLIHEAHPKTEIFFIAIKPSPSRWGLRSKFTAANLLVAQACEADPRLTYVDVVPPMLDADGKPRPELFQSDRLHMTSAGYSIWTERVTESLKSRLSTK